jgi:endonuclease G
MSALKPLILFLTIGLMSPLSAINQDSLIRKYFKYSPEMLHPKTKFNHAIVHHTAYDLMYNEQHEQADWVAYELTAQHTIKAVERSNKFIEDPLVKTGSATNDDYAGSGYDRGHLAPAADMGWSQLTMDESFYFSNMSPQMPNLNRGLWKQLEEQVRLWAKEDSIVLVVTGPVLRDSLPSIGPNKVSIPNAYYKVIFDVVYPEIKAIAFVMPNQAIQGNVEDYRTTVDSVEHLTGIDFFPLLDNHVETILESGYCRSCWHFKVKTNHQEKTDYSDKDQVAETTKVKVNSVIQSKQCKGKSQSGVRCKRNTKNPNGYCFQHGGN